MSRVFLSHSSKDNFEAIAICDWLAAEGWNDVFLDLDPEGGIAAGERWERALHEASTRCEAVIFLVSANWLASGWCLKEYALARGLNKKLFAVMIDPGKTLADLPPELRGTWQVIDLTGGQDMQVLRVPLPGSHEEKHVTFAKEGLRRLKRGLEKAGLDPKFFAWPPAADRQRAPYRGLKPLDGVDAGIFFGRDAPIVEATDRLRGLRVAAAPRLLVILGASGAGKSSFLRAGLLPRLARDDSAFLPLPLIRPERAALYGESGLLGALGGALPTRTRADLRAAIHAGAAGVRPLLAELVDASFKRTLAGGETAKPPVVVIAIDQAEELFRAEGAAEGAALLGLIRDLTIEDQPAVIAIFAIRSDSYDALEHAKSFEGLPQSTLPLLPMPRGAYKDVIEGPARRFVEADGRLTIEPQLTQRLLEDLDKGGRSDALPLLAFTLEQLFLEYHQAGALRLVNYEEFGGLRGAIDAAVERAFLRADAVARIPCERTAREALLRRGFIPWLAGIDPETRSPRRNIARRSDIPDEAGALIDLLVEERLLATDVVVVKDAESGVETRTATIEPAHEALLRQWGLLQGWLEEDFGLLAMLEGIKRATRDWDANARSDAWLVHHEQRLVEAQALDARPDIAARLDPIDRAYLAGCRAKEEAARAEAEARRREREEALALALKNESRAFAALSVVAAKEASFVGSIGLALAGWPRTETDPRPQLEVVLQSLALGLSTLNPVRCEYRHDAPVRGALLTRDETRILSWSDDKTLRLWDVETGRQIGPAMQHDNGVLGKHVFANAVNGALLTRDETRILSWSNDHTLRLWDLATARQIGPAMQHDDVVWGALLIRDETRILSWSWDGTLRLWDASWHGRNLLEIACNYSPPDHDLSAVSTRYGVKIADPICQPDKAIPVPDWSSIERAPAN